MLSKEPAVEIPVAEVTENSTRIEETGLQMEELESRVAPNIVWGD
jgi:hypothetical protein